MLLGRAQRAPAWPRAIISDRNRFFYSYREPGRFAFASEIKALLALDPKLREIEPAALDQYLALRLIAPPLSMFHGVHKLPPGHLLVVERGGRPV